MDLKVYNDKNNPNLMIVTGKTTHDIKGFLKSEYDALWDAGNKEWLINKPDQKYELEANKVYARLRAKVYERTIQKKFAEDYFENPTEENMLNYGKSILVFSEKINITRVNAAVDKIENLAQEEKNEQAPLLAYFKSVQKASDHLMEKGELEKGEHMVYFDGWEKRAMVADDLIYEMKENRRVDNRFAMNKDEPEQVKQHQRR